MKLSIDLKEKMISQSSSPSLPSHTDLWSTFQRDQLIINICYIDSFFYSYNHYIHTENNMDGF